MFVLLNKKEIAFILLAPACLQALTKTAKTTTKKKQTSRASTALARLFLFKFSIF
jgi:hypothetical protein